MSSIRKQPLGTLGYSEAPQRVPLLTGVNLHELRFRLTATVDIAAGGGADGAVVSEGVQRFIRSLRVSHDGDQIVQPINGRDAYQLSARLAAAITAAANLAGPGIATTPVSVDFVIPFARRYLARPADTVWPKSIPVNQELALYVEFETARANGGDSAGSGAFITGGTRVVTITAVQLTIVQVYSTGDIIPWFAPRITVRQTEQVAAGRADLPLLLTGALRFDGVLYRFLEAATLVAADRINTVSLMSGGGATRFWDAVNFRMLQREEAANFPAVGAADQTGTLFAQMIDNGLLGTAFDPRDKNDPRFQFDVAAPGAGVGQVRGVFMELQPRAPYTSVKQ